MKARASLKRVISESRFVPWAYSTQQARSIVGLVRRSTPLSILRVSAHHLSMPVAYPISERPDPPASQTQQAHKPQQASDLGVEALLRVAVVISAGCSRARRNSSGSGGGGTDSRRTLSRPAGGYEVQALEVKPRVTSPRLHRSQRSPLQVTDRDLARSPSGESHFSC